MTFFQRFVLLPCISKTYRGVTIRHQIPISNPIRCRDCDAVLPAEARFCLSCGARVELEAPASTVDPLFETLKNAIGFQYRIERLLGRGGMGAVYLAHELALAVDRCLQRDLTKRWPDAKSLREALLPSDEEPDDSLPGRLLRISVTMGSLAVLAFVSLSVYVAINPDFKFVPSIIGPIPFAVVAIVMAGGATIRLRSHGLDGRSILMRALQQPRWWRSWYPRALRRRGDVWSRLPRELRRFRLCRGMVLKE